MQSEMTTPEMTTPEFRAHLKKALSDHKGGALVGVLLPEGVAANPAVTGWLEGRGLVRQDDLRGYLEARPHSTWQPDSLTEALRLPTILWAHPQAEFSRIEVAYDPSTPGMLTVLRGALLSDALTVPEGRVVGMMNPSVDEMRALVGLGWTVNRTEGATTVVLRQHRPDSRRNWERVGYGKLLIERDVTSRASATGSAVVRVLRDYQSAAMNALEDHWAVGNTRACVLMVTGSGKSLLIAASVQRWLAQHAENSALILSSRTILNMQNGTHIATEIAGETPLPDDTVGILMSGYRPEDHHRIVVSTMQSLHNLPERMRGKGLMIVVDEAHEAASWGADIEALRPARILGVTATPGRSDRKPLRKIFHTLIQGLDYPEALNRGMLVRPRYYIARRSLDDQSETVMELLKKSAKLKAAYQALVAAENELAHCRELIALPPESRPKIEGGGKTLEDRLDDLRVAAQSARGKYRDEIALEGKASGRGDYTSSELDALAGSPVTLAADVATEVADLCTDADGFILPGVVFTHSVEYAAVICAQLNQAGIPAAVVSARTPKAERERIDAAYRAGDITALCNVGVFTTGWDSPQTCWAAIARPTKNASLWVQMIGRVLRPHPGKESAIVLDFTDSFVALGPAEMITSDYWQGRWERDGGRIVPVQRGGGFSKPVERDCECGNHWKGTPVCPSCGSIRTGAATWAASNAEAVRLRLEEAAPTQTPRERRAQSILGSRSALEGLLMANRGGKGVEAPKDKGEREQLARRILGISENWMRDDSWRDSGSMSEVLYRQMVSFYTQTGGKAGSAYYRWVELTGISNVPRGWREMAALPFGTEIPELCKLLKGRSDRARHAKQKAAPRPAPAPRPQPSPAYSSPAQIESAVDGLLFR